MKIEAQTKYNLGDIVKYKTGGPGNMFYSFDKIRVVEVAFMLGGEFFIRYYMDGYGVYILEKDIVCKIGDDKDGE